MLIQWNSDYPNTRSRMSCRLLKFLSHPELATKLSIPSLVLKASAFSCKMGPLIDWSSASFWRNHMHIAEPSALFIYVKNSYTKYPGATQNQLADVDCDR
ncbi:conserved hypothetical protein [Trichinella spiralis]|uniref:hypothetical protein n=1 Tax=Trichinella spiralis TaxID=6334 RepID=UPI0001EFECCB|nr:conserved hypothetical protein [Trichinella spiralis]